MANTNITLAQARKSEPIILISVFVLVVIAFLGTVFYVRGSTMMERQVRQRLMMAAGMAAVQFSPVDLEQIRQKSDMDKPVYKAIVDRLQAIKRQVPNIRYVYLMRKTDDPNQLQFIADADSLLSKDQLDLNHDGVISDDEQPSLPGDLYDATESPRMRIDAWSGPAVDDSVVTDQWGSWISGYAPVLDSSGQAVAIIGLDMRADDFSSAVQSIFSPVALILLLLIALLIAAYIVIVHWQQKLADYQEIEVERSALMELAMHQFGAPLATFKWWVEIMEEQAQSVRDIEICGQLEEGIARMTAVIAALKEASQISEGTLKYTAEDTSLRQLLTDVADEFAARSKLSKQKLIVETQASITSVKLDKKLIAGVVRELIDNAMSYSRHDSKIYIRASDDGRKMLQVSVEDSGCGIPKDDIPHIFEKFKRGSNATKFKPVGNGLGLFIARGIIERAGGAVSVKSTEGRGTTVSFTLPK